MNIYDYEAVKRHICIENVAYHLCLEPKERVGNEIKVICPFCGYNRVGKEASMCLNTESNKYHCFRCGAGGYSIGLFAKVKMINNTDAFNQLLQRECFSQDKASLKIIHTNMIADVYFRDKIYRRFLGMLKLDPQHKKILKELGFLDSSIENGLYKSIPKNYIKRRLVTNALSKEFNLAGTPGFFQEEDFKWCFSRNDGFFIPIYDNDGYIEGLSIHLDKPYNDNKDIWFSSNNKINGTQAKSWIMKSNIDAYADIVFLTDNLLLGNYIKEVTDAPIIAFQNITNSYMILKEIERTNIRNIVFVIQVPYINDNLDYITNRVFRDLIPLGYNLDIKCVNEFKDILNINVDDCYYMGNVA